MPHEGRNFRAVKLVDRVQNGEVKKVPYLAVKYFSLTSFGSSFSLKQVCYNNEKFKVYGSEIRASFLQRFLDYAV